MNKFQKIINIAQHRRDEQERLSVDFMQQRREQLQREAEEHERKIRAQRRGAWKL